MKKIILILSILTIGIEAQAQKTKKKEKPKEPIEVKNLEPTKEELEARRAIAAQTESRMMGPMHHMLMQFVGHWREEMKIWNSPESQPTIVMALRESKLFGEGRFITSMIVGQMGNLPYEAQSVMGYDNVKNVFVKTWYDNMGTSILVLEGIFNEKTSTIDFNGFANDPLTKQPIKIHQVLKIIDAQNQLLEIFTEQKEGVEIKVMEVRSVHG